MSVLCLSPTPLAAARAARRLCDAEGGILFGPAVWTLPRAVSAALAASGDGRPVLTPLSERMVALQAGEAAGGGLAGLAADGGLAAALSRALVELRRGEVEAKDLRAAAGGLLEAAAGRLGVMAGALEAFEVRLEELGVLDAAGATRAAAEAVRRRAWPEGELDTLVLDGLVELSPAEWAFVAALVARARRTRAFVPFFPERPELCAPAEPLLRRLESLHELASVRELEVVLQRLDGRAPRIAGLLSAFAGGPADRAADGPGLLLALPGAGEAGEAEAVAGAAARLLEAGFAPEEVVLVAERPARVAAGLERAFRARGLPLSVGRGSPAAAAPVLGVVRELLRSAGRLDRESAARLAGSSWLVPGGIPGLRWLLDRAGAVEPRGSAAEALRRRAGILVEGAARERRRLGAAAGRLEELEAALSPLARPGPARLHARRLSALLERLGLRRRAARGPLGLAAEDLSALSALEAASEEVVRAAVLAGRAEAALSPPNFLALLFQALQSATLPLQDDPAAGAVELAGPDEVSGAPARAAIVLCCGEDSFPAPTAPEPLLREPERQALCRHLRRAAVPTAGARRARALHRAFLSAAAGREAVAFAWPAPGPAGDGGPPAPLAEEALAAAGVVVPATPAEPTLPTARTVRAALRAAARLGGAGAAALEGTPLAGRARQALARGEVERQRRTAVLGRGESAFAGVVEGGALSVLGEALPAEWSPSQLEANARCPFPSFLRLALKLPEEEEVELDIEAREEGSLLHEILERFVSARLRRGAWPPTGGAEDLAEARAIAAEVLARFEREGRTGDPAAWVGRLEAILHRLDRLVAAEARQAGGLTPRLLEHAFGGGAAAPALEVAAGGERVLLKGRIDRVDADPDRLLVIDYKNSRGGDAHRRLLDPEAFGVDSFQIPTYLIAASKELPGRALSATLWMLRRPARLEPVSLPADDPRLAPCGAEGAPGSFAAAVLERVSRMRAGRFPIVSRSCRRCAYGAVCRFEGLAERGPEEER
ncbi:MAG TPA: PD-(D/E)XK nuclease family protein [Anaeromyxobacter sp.]|nr:PD-(D/E)XK nuclease family protein [Anaeromyxobacter sp.]